MAHEDPQAELARLLSEESLQEAFKRVLVSVVRRISDGGYFPAGDFIKEVETGNAVEWAKNWLRDDRAQPLFDLLLSHGRHDLTVEWYVARPPYTRLFDGIECAVYRERLAAFTKGRPWMLLASRWPGPPTVPAAAAEFAEKAIANLEEDRFYEIEDLIKLQRRRAAEHGPLPIHDQLISLNKELESAYPFTCSASLKREVSDDPRLRDRFPRVAAGVDRVPEVGRLFGPQLDLYRRIFDMSAEKIAQVDALLQTSEAFEDLWAEKVLYFRAAFVCSLIGRLIPQVAAIFFAGESAEGEIRDLASQFASPDAALVVAVAILSRMFNHEDLLAPFKVISFGDLPASDWLHHEIFDPEKAIYREGLPDENGQAAAVNVEAVVKFVLAYANRLVGDRGTLVLPPPRSTIPPKAAAAR